MIKYYTVEKNKLKEIETFKNINQLVWIDMVAPTKVEENSIEGLLSISVPTIEEMKGIETSSLLYTENSVIYLTIILVTEAEIGKHHSRSVTFIIKENTIITLRYGEVEAFNMFLNRSTREQAELISSGVDIFLGIMEAVMDCMSKSFELISNKLDSISSTVFQKTKKEGGKEDGLQNVLKNIGRSGDLNGKLLESLLSLSRAFGYLLLINEKYEQIHKSDIETYLKDIGSLNEYATRILNRVNLLLDATLGMINIEQNGIIKIFSVAAVVFLPPTLIASIYGMNFKNMPELSWTMGYPFSITLMVLSSILPYLYFKKKNWL